MPLSPEELVTIRKRWEKQVSLAKECGSMVKDNFGGADAVVAVDFCLNFAKENKSKPTIAQIRKAVTQSKAGA